MLASIGSAITDRVSAPPTCMAAVSGLTIMPFRGCTTVTLQVELTTPLSNAVTVTVAVPGFKAVSVPSALTDTTPVLLDIQETVLFVGSGFSGSSIAVSPSAVPTFIVTAVWLSLMPVTNWIMLTCAEVMMDSVLRESMTTTLR